MHGAAIQSLEFTSIHYTHFHKSTHKNVRPKQLKKKDMLRTTRSKFVNIP